MLLVQQSDGSFKRELSTPRYYDTCQQQVPGQEERIQKMIKKYAHCKPGARKNNELL